MKSKERYRRREDGIVGCAPVLFLIFNRPDTTAQVMQAIREARPSRLYVAADGPRNWPGEAELCEKARRIATAVDWPCEVKTLLRIQNLGPRRAVVSAIDWFFENEEGGVILEDDCLPSLDFFKFCTALLERYQLDIRVMAICGSSYAKLGPGYAASYYFSYYADIWGWATWRRAWQYYDRDLSRWPEFKARRGLDIISSGGKSRESYWTSVFDATRKGRIETWDYQWIFTVIFQGGLACYPTRNLVSNLGFRADATHTVINENFGRPHPAAGLPLAALSFPLNHPPRIARFRAAESQIEASRLGLTRPPLEIVRRTKAIARRALGEKAAGVLDYFRFGISGAGMAGPFNGQPARQALFGEIVASVRPDALVETGTNQGATTDFIAQTGLPVFTIEFDPRLYGFARTRLWRRRNITLLHGDSRTGLRKLFDGPLRRLTESTLFFYLDAHWNDDLPLGEEIDILFDRCPTAIVMIDDFQVPWDPGYGYDDYGPGKALVFSYIAPAVSAHCLRALYPSTPAAEEGGLRRGCVVLANEKVHGCTLASIQSLRLSEKAERGTVAS